MSSESTDNLSSDQEVQSLKPAFSEPEEGPALPPKKPDMVNHPAHYTSDPSGVECITITRWRNFNIGNAMKYLWRAGLKDEVEFSKTAKQVEDLRKAIWYIEDEIKRLIG